MTCPLSVPCRGPAFALERLCPPQPHGLGDSRWLRDEVTHRGHRLPGRSGPVPNPVPEGSWTANLDLSSQGVWSIRNGVRLPIG